MWCQRYSNYLTGIFSNGIKSMRLQFGFSMIMRLQFFSVSFKLECSSLAVTPFSTIVRKFQRSGNDNPEKSTLSTMIKCASFRYLWSNRKSCSIHLSLILHQLCYFFFSFCIETTCAWNTIAASSYCIR